MQSTQSTSDGNTQKMEKQLSVTHVELIDRLKQCSADTLFLVNILGQDGMKEIHIPNATLAICSMEDSLRHLLQTSLEISGKRLSKNSKETE